MFYPQKLIKIIGALLQVSQSWQSAPSVLTTLPLTFYESHQLFLLQECDRIGYQKNTKFLAKTYFDLAVLRLPQLNQKNANLYLMTALALATKFNQNRVISEQITPEALSTMCESEYSPCDFILAQIQMLEMLEFRLSIVSPYDFADLFSQIAQQSFRKSRRQEIETIIDFAITLPSLSLQHSRRIFLGCLLNIMQNELKERQMSSLEALISEGEWKEIKIVVGVIKKSIEQIFREEEKKKDSS